MSATSIERTWSEDDLAEAVRDQFRLQLISIGHVMPQGAVHVTDNAVMAHVGRDSLYNRATALSLDQLDLALAEVTGFFHGLAHSLWLDGDAVDEETDRSLRGRGYVPLPPQHGMACLDLPAAIADNETERVELLTEPSQAAAVADVGASSFGLGVDDRMLLEDLGRAILRHAKPWDHGALYGVEEDDKLVSVGAMMLSRRVAALAGLATLPRYRDHHDATAIIARALNDARAMGAEIAVCLAAPDSESTLTRLGFRTMIDYRVYRQARP